MKRQVIFDTDPSPDDAVAFLATLASPEEFDVLAITTVAGNVPVDLTSKNARKALELAKRTDIPVYAGASTPLVRKLVTAEARPWSHRFRRIRPPLNHKSRCTLGSLRTP